MQQTQFCVALPLYTDLEWKWVREKILRLQRMHEDVDTGEEINFLAEGVILGFQVKEEYDRVLLYNLEDGNLNHLTLFLQQYLQQFHPSSCIPVEYAYTNTQPIPKLFGGGAVLITADRIIHAPDQQSWLKQQKHSYESTKIQGSVQRTAGAINTRRAR